MAYERSSYGPRMRGKNRQRGSFTVTGRGGGAAKVTIANLDSEVTDGDIREIFMQVGRVLNAVVNYDPSGRSRGTAEVTFASRQIAAKAVQEYDRAEVDGRPMFLTLVGGGTGGSIASRVLIPRTKSRYQSRIQEFEDDEEDADDRNDLYDDYQQQAPRRQTQGKRRNLGGVSRRGGRSKRGGGGGRQYGGDSNAGGRRDRDRKPMKTAAELDAELDEYHKSSGSSSHTGGSSRQSRNQGISGFTGQPSMPS